MMHVAKPWRNHGYSFGLEYPFVFGEVPATGKWSVWHRHTGEIVFEADINPQLAVCLGYYAAFKECIRLNRCDGPNSHDHLA